jgi:aryl-alcohol dehydrogenase-like predicted oxidoreductase
MGIASGFFGYNVLAGGVLTGKYLDEPPAWDPRSAAAKGDAFGTSPGSSSEKSREQGRFDDENWGRTLYR